MAIPTYTPGYPPDGSSLGSTKAVIRDNLDGQFQVFSVDHYNQNGSNPGFHQQSTYPISAFAPTTVSGQIAQYSKAISGKSVLFNIRDGDPTTETQVTTGAFSAPVASQNGYTYLPGGLILQWGLRVVTLTSPNSTGNVIFPFVSMNSIFNILFSPVCVDSGTGSTSVISLVSFTMSAGKINGFNWNAATSSNGKYANFYWSVIGN